MNTPVSFRDTEGPWEVRRRNCAACKREILHLHSGKTITALGNSTFHSLHSEMIKPISSGRLPCPPEVPDDIGVDYKEAALVLPFSATASAALSRRCLQTVLREHANVKASDLSKEIEEFIGRAETPSALAESVDYIRNVGNFAAHPIKSTKSGEIFDVEPGEAEWNLDVLESLFDYMFVQPRRMRAKRDTLDQKLSEAGKPPMK